MMIALFAENKSPRLEYTLEVIFLRCLGLDFKLFTDWNKFSKLEMPRINYSLREHSNSMRIVPHKLLYEAEIRPVKTRIHDWSGIPAFFRTNKGGECPYDIFAATFYLVSRYEEYLAFNTDAHGRFPASLSLAYKEGFLERPLVNEWADRIAEMLSKGYPDYRFKARKFCFKSTIDIDMAFCYKNKGLMRNVGGMAKDLVKLRFSLLLKRLKVLANREADPFDNFEYQRNIHANSKTELLYFVLMAEGSKYDKNISITNPEFIQLIDQLAENYQLGIHPSYYSYKGKKRMKRELERLQEITLKPIIDSRQHFLRFTLPGTFLNLENIGIENEYSMGYSDVVGFRAGICVPYPFFNLIKNKKHSLIIHPFAVMDVALKNSLSLSPQEAIERINSLLATVKKHEGQFISVFHNESLSNFDQWAGWRSVYEAMLHKGRELS
jgi:hypothetical protein